MNVEQLLHEHDPAATAPLSTAEISRLREALRTAGARRSAGFRGTLRMAASILLMSAALAAVVSIRTTFRNPPPIEVSRLQLTAPGGTRIIWFLRKE